MKFGAVCHSLCFICEDSFCFRGRSHAFPKTGNSNWCVCCSPQRQCLISFSADSPLSEERLLQLRAQRDNEGAAARDALSALHALRGHPSQSLIVELIRDREAWSLVYPYWKAMLEARLALDDIQKFMSISKEAAVLLLTHTHKLQLSCAVAIATLIEKRASRCTLLFVTSVAP